MGYCDLNGVIFLYLNQFKNPAMNETTLERQILSRLASMEKKVNCIMEYIEDSKLSVDDKKALVTALKEEKEGKLLSKKQVFG